MVKCAGHHARHRPIVSDLLLLLAQGVAAYGRCFGVFGHGDVAIEKLKGPALDFAGPERTSTLTVTMKVSQKNSPGASAKKSHPALPWPPCEAGQRVRVARSPVATYYVGIGLARWFPLDRQVSIWLRPERWRNGRAFPELCCGGLHVQMFRGLTPDVRREVERLFGQVVADLRALAARERSPR